MNITDVDDAETLAMVAQAAAEFAKPDAQRTRHVRDTTFGHDPKTWAQMADNGWLGVLVPEVQNGTHLGIRFAAVIAERLGYACYTEAYVPVAVVAVSCLEKCPDGDLRNELLQTIGEGTQLATLAWQSPRGGLSLDANAVQARPVKDAYCLAGSVRFVSVPQADVFLVASHLGSELAVWAVSANAPGVTVKRETMTDGSQSGWITLSDVVVPMATMLARGFAAEVALGTAVDAGVLATSAELLGLMDRTLEVTQSYLAMRQQFGQAIGAFQVLQHRAVDMWIQKSLTRAALRSAVNTFADPGASVHACRSAASSVKARASEAGLLVAGQAVQLHGAIGVSDEYELGVYVNRSVALAAYFGNAAAHRRRFGELVAVQER